MEIGISTQVAQFQRLIDGIAPLVGEARIRFTPDGATISAVDAGNVAMADVTLDSDAFAAYPDGLVDDGDELVVGVNLPRLQDMLSVGGDADMLHATFDTDMGTADMYVGDVDYTTGLIAAGSIREEPDLPDLDLPVIVNFEMGDLKRAVKAAELVGDKIEFVSLDGESELHARAEGDTDEVLVRFRPNEELENPIPESAVAASVFSTEYLNSITSALPNSDTMLEVHLGEEFPVLINFGTGDNYHGRYAVAPRVSNR